MRTLFTKKVSGWKYWISRILKGGNKTKVSKISALSIKNYMLLINVTGLLTVSLSYYYNRETLSNWCNKARFFPSIGKGSWSWKQKPAVYGGSIGKYTSFLYF